LPVLNISTDILLGGNYGSVLHAVVAVTMIVTVLHLVEAVMVQVKNGINLNNYLLIG
jgi:hypothetical protein